MATISILNSLCVVPLHKNNLKTENETVNFLVTRNQTSLVITEERRKYIYFDVHVHLFCRIIENAKLEHSNVQRHKLHAALSVQLEYEKSVS